MKFAELLAERKAIEVLVEDLICDWIRFDEMPGYCKENDPYKWFYQEDKNVPGDESCNVFMDLCKCVEEELKFRVGEEQYEAVGAEDYIGKVIQKLDEDKYHWDKNTYSKLYLYTEEQERLERIDKISRKENNG